MLLVSYGPSPQMIHQASPDHLHRKALVQSCSSFGAVRRWQYFVGSQERTLDRPHQSYVPSAHTRIRLLAGLFGGLVLLERLGMRYRDSTRGHLATVNPFA